MIHPNEVRIIQYINVDNKENIKKLENKSNDQINVLKLVEDFTFRI